jgi:hypothetical protein
MTQSNPKGLEVILQHLKELENKEGKVGWFPSSVYEDGKPVAQIAVVQEYGATIHLPGGTPYKITPEGAVFVKKSEGAALPVTKPHTIVIPARPFMRPTIDREKNNWMNFFGQGIKKILEGKTTAINVLDILVQRARGDVQKTISQVTTPPLKPGTIRARLRKRSNKNLVGDLHKPLIDTALMFNSVEGKVENTK